MQAKVAFGKKIYLIDIDEYKPGPIRVSRVNPDHEEDPSVPILQDFANRKHYELVGRYIPHSALAIAEMMEKKLDAKILWYNMPEPGPVEGPEPIR